MKTFINNQRLASLAGVDFDSEKIRPGKIVYSRTHKVTCQFAELKKYDPCVLITSFSDAIVTQKMACNLPRNVIAWYSNNVACHDDRVIAIPLGIRTSSEIDAQLKKHINKGRQKQKNLVYMNFWRKIPRSYNPRRGMYERFGGKSWITKEGGFYHVSLEHFYDQILRHPYVLSPPGAGPDCHRHWESILLGAIPIVMRSLSTSILDGLPCLQVTDWDEVTPERLKKELPRLKKLFNSPKMEICWFEYWKQKILKNVNRL